MSRATFPTAVRILTNARSTVTRWALALAIGVFAVACGGGPASRSPVVDPFATTAPAAPRPVHSVDRPALLPDAIVVPLEQHGTVLLAKASIDGRPVGDFIVDTGANATVIDSDLAERLGLPPIIDTQVAAIHSDIATTLLRPARLAVGDVELSGDPTVALPLGHIGAQLGTPIAGIIGFPTLGGVPFTLDFVEATLTTHAPARFTPPSGVEGKLLRVHQNLPFVEVMLANGLDAWLMLDTGATTSVALWTAFAERHPDVLSVPHKRWALSVGAGGGTQVKVSELKYLRLFDREYTAMPVTIQAAPTAAWNHPRVAGLLGLDLLKETRVTIDPDRKRIWVVPAAH